MAEMALNIDEMLAQIIPELLPYPMNKYAKAIGITGLYNLCKLTGGRRIYIPKPDALFNEHIKGLIISDYKSGSFTIEELAQKYEVSPKTVWSYIHF